MDLYGLGSRPPVLRCDLGARDVDGTSPPDVWDEPILGPDANAVSPFPPGPRGRTWSEHAPLLTQPSPDVTVRFGGRDKPARCVGQADTGTGY